jgi:hypothetical protein
MSVGRVKNMYYMVGGGDSKFQNLQYVCDVRIGIGRN